MKTKLSRLQLLLTYAACLLLGALTLIFGSGCVSMGKGTAKVIDAMAKDKATVAVKITSVYGNATVTRIGQLLPGQTVSVNSDGSMVLAVPATNAPAK